MKLSSEEKTAYQERLMVVKKEYHLRYLFYVPQAYIFNDIELHFTRTAPTPWSASRPSRL